MSIEMLAIPKLPSTIEGQLQPIGDSYVCKNFTKDYIGERVVCIGKNVYYRFMDFFYLPQRPESLSTEQVVEICDLRSSHMSELVDTQLNERIVDMIVEQVSLAHSKGEQSLRTLDFGCGSGFSTRLLKERLPHMSIVGADISAKAIEDSKNNGLIAYQTSPTGKLCFEDNEFDYIFAIFVMHFNVDLSTLAELSRILRPSGKFLFNVYERNLDSLIQQLSEVGFESTLIEDDSMRISAKHKIVSCCVASHDETGFVTNKQRC